MENQPHYVLKNYGTSRQLLLTGYQELWLPGSESLLIPNAKRRLKVILQQPVYSTEEGESIRRDRKPQG